MPNYLKVSELNLEMIRDPGSCVIYRHIYERTRHFRHFCPSENPPPFYKGINNYNFFGCLYLFPVYGIRRKMAFYSATVNSIQEF